MYQDFCHFLVFLHHFVFAKLASILGLINDKVINVKGGKFSSKASSFFSCRIYALSGLVIF